MVESLSWGQKNIREGQDQCTGARNFTIYAHTFKTIYFEFNFASDTRSESSFIILLVHIVFPIPFIT